MLSNRRREASGDQEDREGSGRTEGENPVVQDEPRQAEGRDDRVRKAQGKNQEEENPGSINFCNNYFIYIKLSLRF